MKNIVIRAQLKGLAPIMFDKFYDHSKEERSAEQKLYLIKGNQVILPNKNLEAFLVGEKPQGAIKAMEGRKANDFLPYAKGHIRFDQTFYPFLDDDDKPIFFKGFDDERFSVDYSSPRVIHKNLSIKQPISPRPVLNLPWKLMIGINLAETEYSRNKVTHDKLYSWFNLGGLIVALGTHRPLYGRFEVAEWEVRE